MSVKIRLAVTGKVHQRAWRIVVQDTRGKRDGKFLENLGFYNPHNKPSFKINNERVDFWLKRGAKPTEAVSRLLKNSPGQ